MSERNDGIWWTYTCAICHEKFHPDDVGAHTQAERDKPDWPGWISYTRSDVLEEEGS